MLQADSAVGVGVGVAAAGRQSGSSKGGERSPATLQGRPAMAALKD